MRKHAHSTNFAGRWARVRSGSAADIPNAERLFAPRERLSGEWERQVVGWERLRGGQERPAGPPERPGAGAEGLPAGADGLDGGWERPEDGRERLFSPEERLFTTKIPFPGSRQLYPESNRANHSAWHFNPRTPARPMPQRQRRVP
jgi:hypothetical protein